MDKSKKDTPVVFMKPHIEVLSERSGGLGLALDGAREKSTIENMELESGERLPRLDLASRAKSDSARDD